LTPSNGNKTGGPAFPHTQWPNETGITLRDYFAAKAMNSLISDPDWRSDMVWHETAYAAYQMADAMMEARNG
jgi:hypothetical protein